MISTATCHLNSKQVIFKIICALYVKNLPVPVSDTFDFESFYTVLLNHFQSSGYADKLFGAVIMVPLATKYDVKWRKMIWSEHVAVLRFISCSEDELIFSQMEDFIQLRKSAEDPNYELSLLKSYNLAISMNQLREDSIPYKIAQFYLANK